MFANCYLPNAFAEKSGLGLANIAVRLRVSATKPKIPLKYTNVTKEDIRQGPWLRVEPVNWTPVWSHSNLERNSLESN